MLLAERGCEKPCRSMPDGRIIKSNRLPCVGDSFIGVALMVCLKKKKVVAQRKDLIRICVLLFFSEPLVQFYSVQVHLIQGLRYIGRYFRG